MQYQYYRLMFITQTDDEVIRSFNREVGNPGWTSSRGAYLAALHEEFNQRQWDYTEIGDESGLSYKRKIRLFKTKILFESNG